MITVLVRFDNDGIGIGRSQYNLCSQRKFRLPDTGSIKFTIKGIRGDEVTKKSISTSACMGHNNPQSSRTNTKINELVVDMKGGICRI